MKYHAPNLCALVAAGLTAIGSPGAESPAAAEHSGSAPQEIEFRVNGEAVTKQDIEEGLRIAESCDLNVCPTDRHEGWRMRRDRLIKLIPMRQFIERQGVAPSEEVIDKRIEELKAHPDPFARHPPKPLSHVMVRECMPWSDLRLMILVESGMSSWAEKEWKKRWPTDRDWSEHCAKERRNLETRFGKFRRISFSIFDWPKGAKNEDEAFAMLEAKALEAKSRIDEGMPIGQVALNLCSSTNSASHSLTAQILPFNFAGEANAGMLGDLAPGRTSEPVRTRLGWELLTKDTLTDDEISRIAKQDFIGQTREAAELRIQREIQLEKVGWTTFE